MDGVKYHGIKFEAKKHAYRQTQDGISVTFIMHPDDVDAAFATAPLGTQYTIIAVENDESGNPKTTPQKIAYQDKTEGEKAVTRAALLCKDQRFRHWYLGETAASKTEAGAAGWIKGDCKISSRSELATNTDALEIFLKLEARFLEETGQRAEER